jgi:hypothetical protein
MPQEIELPAQKSKVRLHAIAFPKRKAGQTLSRRRRATDITDRNEKDLKGGHP